MVSSHFVPNSSTPQFRSSFVFTSHEYFFSMQDHIGSTPLSSRLQIRCNRLPNFDLVQRADSMFCLQKYKSNSKNPRGVCLGYRRPIAIGSSLNFRLPHHALQDVVDVHGGEDKHASRAPFGLSIPLPTVGLSVAFPRFKDGSSITNEMSEITIYGLGCGSGRDKPDASLLGRDN